MNSRRNSFLLFVYRLFVVPLGALIILLILPFHKKVRATIGLRLKRREWPEWTGQSPTLWIHCASGEFEYAKPLIREWKHRHPYWKIYVTYFSPSFKKGVESHPGVDASGPLPLDLPGPMRGFIKKLNPSLLAVARTDLWPELTATCAQLRVPVILFSATRRPLKFFEKLTKFAVRWRYQGADQIFTVSEKDKHELDKLKIGRPVKVLGDTRYDQVVERLRNPKPLPVKIRSHMPILICGSTWTPDEKVILAATTDLLKTGSLALILVPHEPTPAHLSALEKQLAQINLKSARFSTLEQWDGSSVLLVDQIGILAELYAKADLGFVGGSYVRTVHSVMEPLGAGLVTIVGPKHLNNREAIEFQNERLTDKIAMVNSARNAKAMTEILTNCLIDTELKSWKPKIQRAVLAKSTATTRVAQHLTDLIL